MNSRMDKYYVTNNEDIKEVNSQDKPVVGSRIKKNQQLYKEVSTLEIEDFDVNNNVSVIGESSNVIDIDKIRDMLDKKYREEPKNKSIGTSNVTNQNGVNLDETREYDLKSVMEKAKSGQEVDYEENRLKKLGNTSYDILKNLDIYDSKDEEEVVEEVFEPEGYDHEDTIAEVFETKVSSKDKELQELINTITAKELVQFEESTSELDPLDILSDLRGDDDKTRVMGALSFGDTATVEMTETNEEDEKLLEASILQDTDEFFKNEDVTEEQPIVPKSNEKNITYDEFEDLRDEGNVLVKVLVFLIIVLVILSAVVLANKSRIWSNTPVYVAGFERGVRPIGDWSIAIILSYFSTPSILSWSPGIVRARFNFFAKVL